MKKVLIITYYWPPSGGSGVQRWMYFSKYLPQFGYEPIVLTVSEKFASYKNEDLSFVEFVKDIKTFKTKSFEPLKFYSKITTGDSKKGIPMGSVKSDKNGLIHKLSLYIRGNYFIPDARIGWNRYAVKKAKELIKDQKIEIVITTGPPHSTHLIGLKLKNELKINWVADFRDPWSEIYYNKLFKRSEKANLKDKRLEEKVLLMADKVTTIGVKLQKLLTKKVSNESSKFHYLYNGYDADAMGKLKKNKQSNFQLTFIGLLTTNQPYKSIITALKKIHSDSKEIDLCFNVAGNIDHVILDELRKELPFITLNIIGYLKHRNALELMKQSDLLLNFLSEMEHSEILISGKQMEYIATGNPILCIGNTNGECAMLLKDIKNAQIFEKNQQTEIVNFIQVIYDKWQNGEDITVPVDSENITSKSRFEVTRKLGQILDQFN